MDEKVTEKRQAKYARLLRADAAVWKRRLARLAWEGAYFSAAYLLGQAPMLFSTYPLGLAFLAAVGGEHLIGVLAGLAVAALTASPAPILYLSVYGVTALVRVLAGLLLEFPDARISLRLRIRQKLTPEGEAHAQAETRRHVFWNRFLDLFSESVCLRMATAAVCTLIASLYRVIVGGFEYYDLFAAVFSVLVTPAAVFVYSVCLSGKTESRLLRLLSGGALLFSVVWSSDGLLLGGFPLAVILALFLSFAVTMREGVCVGCASAVLSGLAFRLLFAPAFLAAVLLYAFFRSMEKESVGILAGVGGAVGWLLYSGGVEHLSTVLPACLIAGAVFTPVSRFSAGKPESADETAEVRTRLRGERYDSSSERFRGISDALSSLSEMFYNLSDRFRRPGTLDLRRICDRSFDAFCPDCPNKTVCWGLEYADTLGTVNQLISSLHTKGRVMGENVPEHLSRRCPSMDGILDRINSDCARLTGEMLRNNRTEIFAMDYEAAAKIINDALEEDDGEYRFDPELEQQVREYLHDAGIGMTGVTVYGKRRLQILVKGVEIDRATVTAETMRCDLGEMCGLELGEPVFEVEGEDSTMLLQAKRKIMVVGAQNNVSADGGVSGDTVNLFSNKKDYFYALINDGMGQGREAALTSNLCSVFLEKMLRAGNRAGTSLRMLNNMIRSRGADSTAECSSTVDLLELDLMTGEGAFIKSGAAPSYVIRGTTVHRLQSGTAPIGIISKLDAQISRFPLRAGDTVVMISDGILQDDPDGKWIHSYLSTCADSTPEEIVYHICLRAAEAERHDDCSAIALRVTECSEEEEQDAGGGES